MDSEAISEAEPATAPVTDEGLKRRLANLTPWPKGTNGRGARRGELIRAELKHFQDHHKREPNHPERLLIDQLVDVRLRKPRNSTESTRRAGSTAKMIETLYGLSRATATAEKPAPERPSLQSILDSA